VIPSIWRKASIAAGCGGGFDGKDVGGDRSALVPVKSSITQCTINDRKTAKVPLNLRARVLGGLDFWAWGNLESPLSTFLYDEGIL
jgi:hypothetical protein